MALKLVVSELGCIVVDDRSNLVDSQAFAPGREAVSHREITSGRCDDSLRELLKRTGAPTLEVQSEEIAKAIAPFVKDVSLISVDIARTILGYKGTLMVQAGFATSEEEASQRIREIARASSSARIREALGRDELHLIEAVMTLDSTDRSFNVLASRLREWYGQHFPELSSVIPDNVQQLGILARGVRKGEIAKPSTEVPEVPTDKMKRLATLVEGSLGGEITDEALDQISRCARGVLELQKSREGLQAYIEEVMKRLAPNLNIIAGSTIGARLIAKVGGVERLARLPASRIQVLGAEKALFRALRTGGRPPKHGIIFQHTSVHSAPKWQRGKIARSLSGKIAIAARLDAYGGGRIEAPVEKVAKRLEEIRERYKEPPMKVPKKEAERGSGRRVRKGG